MHKKKHNNKKKTLLILAVVLVLGIAAALGIRYWQNWRGVFFVHDFKVAVLDLEKIFQEAPQSALMRDKINDQFSPRKESVDSLQKSIETKIAELNKTNPPLKFKERRKILLDIDKKEHALSKMQMDLHEDLVAIEKTSIETVVKQIQDVTADLAKEEKFSLVLAKNVVIYPGNNADLSAQVVDTLKRE